MPRYNPEENDQSIHTRRSHPSRDTGPRAPSAYDYRDDFARRDTGRFGDLSRYAGADDYYDGAGERREARRARDHEPRTFDRTDWRNYGAGRERYLDSREGEALARRYEEHRGPGEGMMDFVRGFFGVGPKNYRRADARIEEDANEAFYHDRYLDASDIEVKAKDGVITLTGTVPDRWSKWRAEDLLEDISGLHDVQNRLTLAKDGGYREEQSILRWARGKEPKREEREIGVGAQANADSLSGRAVAVSADDAAAVTGTSAITGGFTPGAPAEEAAGEEGTFGSRGMPGTTTTGGFNNTVVVHPVDDDKTA